MDSINDICNASASILAMPPKLAEKKEGHVVPDYILDHCAAHPQKRFLTQPMGGDEIRTWTFGEFLSESKKMAAHIESLDLPVPSQIAIMSKNCAWWLMADLAISESSKEFIQCCLIDAAPPHT